MQHGNFLWKQFAESSLLKGALLSFVSLIGTASAASQTNASLGVWKGPYQSTIDTSGADSALSYSGQVNYFQYTGSKNILRSAEQDLSATASLVSGQLKVYDQVTVGSIPFNSGVITPNIGGIFTSAEAAFGDTFYSYTANNSPYIWGSTANAHFDFAVTGSVDVPQAVAEASPINTATSINTYLSFSAYSTDMSQLLYSHTWHIGPYILDDSEFPPDPAFNSFVEIDAEVPTHLTADFSPNQDFRWFLRLGTIVNIDGIWGDVQVTSDFSHTVVASYTPPEGVVTFSDSGKFPGTQTLSNTPAVPEPSAGWLLLVGLGVIGHHHIRNHRKSGRRMIQ